MSLAEEILKEYDELEAERRESQYKNVLTAFRDNLKKGSGTTLLYYSIIYDDVRERLEKEGFSVRTVTSGSYGNQAAYLISKKEESKEVRLYEEDI